MPKNPKCTQRKGCICFNVLLLGSFHRRAFHRRAFHRRRHLRRAYLRRRPIGAVEPPRLPCGQARRVFLPRGGRTARSPRLSRPRLSEAFRFSPFGGLLPFRPPQSGKACAFCGGCVGAVSLSVSVLSSGCAVPRPLRCVLCRRIRTCLSPLPVGVGRGSLAYPPACLIRHRSQRTDASVRRGVNAKTGVNPRSVKRGCKLHHRKPEIAKNDVVRGARSVGWPLPYEAASSLGG